MDTDLKLADMLQTEATVAALIRLRRYVKSFPRLTTLKPTSDDR